MSKSLSSFLSFSLVTLSALKGQDTLIDAFKGTQIEGFVYSQYTSIFGRDGNGNALQHRLWVDLTTGSYHGFTIGSRVFVDVGTGGPDGGTLLENSSPRDDSFKLLSVASPLPVSIMTLYGRQTFDEAKVTIEAGQINIVTPFTDYAWDFGYGVALMSEIVDNLTLNLQAYGAWALDNFNNIHASPTDDGGDHIKSDKALLIWGLQGRDLSSFNFNAYLAHAIDTIDFLLYTDLSYSWDSFNLDAQIVGTQVNVNNPYFASKGKAQAAKLRGLYNLQANFEHEGIGLLVGYTGSFGDGYGALLNYTAGFNMGGNIWWDVGSGNGYALNGVGGFQAGKKASIQVAYTTLSYSAIPDLFLGLSYAYVGGNNQYRLMQKGYNNRQNSDPLLGGSIDAQLHELSLALNYDINDRLSIFTLLGSTFGDLMIGKFQTRINYAF